ncbi:transcriptional regulator-like protein [Catenovulum agarivorans DS-2]|uniref:Transcriptional regulator-like protein n=1 Tax=Catenovulum agarivorans DS-2 TaxID=1328313 RepID=W7Q9B1_9ALTE|nr:nuclear transport factor 2 family protein [Catenovulum agarivorans]EWH09399.1 transcriptional regulator-like protein [Catenovulum agarivorans DS-2]
MDKNLVENFVKVYQSLSKDNLETLAHIYDSDIVFQDPLHTIAGLDNLTQYMANMYENVQECFFDIHEHHFADQQIFLYWTMHFIHPKLNKGETILVEGHSRLKFIGNKVICHRDYFDVGAMLYEHVPLVGGVVSLIKNRASG